MLLKTEIFEHARYHRQVQREQVEVLSMTNDTKIGLAVGVHITMFAVSCALIFSCSAEWLVSWLVFINVTENLGRH